MSFVFFFFKQKTAYEMRISDWSSDVCSSDLLAASHGLVPSMAVARAGPARYWGCDGGRPVLGVITPMSQHFCATCNRVRLGADGTLYLCLDRKSTRLNSSH